jgi:hypothetical protein
MKNLSILFAAFAVLFLVSCSKENNDSELTLVSNRTSRVAGTWTYDKLFVNGVDITSSILTAGEEYTLQFTQDGGYFFSYSNTSQSYSDSGSWHFTDGIENIAITNTLGEVVTYKILRLTNFEMWWSETDGADTYEYHFKVK